MRKIKTICVIVLIVALVLSCTLVGVYLAKSDAFHSLWTSVDDHLHSLVNQYVHDRYDNPYRGKYNWSEVLNVWEDDEMPVGSMEQYLVETEEYEIYTKGMTVYAKEELIGYLEDSRPTLTLPVGMTVPGSIQKTLLELHKDWPIEVIVREPDMYTEKPCVGAVYKVQDQEGKIEFLHVVFYDAYGPSKYYPSEYYVPNHMLEEYGTDALGQTITKRSNDELEKWIVNQLNEYYITESFP